MKFLVAVVAIVAVLVVVAEVAAPMLVEARIEQRVAERTGEGIAVDADAGSFPFLPGVLGEGRVDRLAVTLTELGGIELPLAEVTLALEGVRLDREALTRGEAEVVDVDRGRATAVLDTGVLGSDVGAGAVDVTGGMVSVAGLQAPVPTDLVPCAPEVASGDEGTTLTCTFEEVPGLLARAAAR